jgi:hypothetical protein
MLLLLSFFCGVIGAHAGDGSGSVDNSLYADLLHKYVKDGVVDYQGFKKEQEQLERYLEVLENVDPKDLSHDERFAYYVNLYNAWTIQLILSGYPGVASIKDLGGFFSSPWKKEIVRIKGDVVTLDHIEHDILRPRFKDPRVHFAINCAARSCPPLQSEPFRGSTLDQQLDEATGSFINDSQSNYLEGNSLHVSRIFKWFGEDFNQDVVGFFLKYAEGDLKERLKKRKDDIDVECLDYDWSLNGK